MLGTHLSNDKRSPVQQTKEILILGGAVCIDSRDKLMLTDYISRF